MALTRSQLRTRTRSFLKEATADYWSDATLEGYLDDAIRVYSSRLGLLTREKTANVVSGQYEYALPSDYVIPALAGAVPPQGYTVAVDGIPLQYLPFQTLQMMKGYGSGAGLGTTPQFWTLFNGTGDTTGAVQSLQVLPTPTAGGTGNLRVAYEAKAAALSADSSVPVIPEEDHECLPWGAAARAYLERGQTEEAAIYQTMFDRRITERLPGGGSAPTQ